MRLKSVQIEVDQWENFYVSIVHDIDCNDTLCSNAKAVDVEATTYGENTRLIIAFRLTLARGGTLMPIHSPGVACTLRRSDGSWPFRPMAARRGWGVSSVLFCWCGLHVPLHCRPLPSGDWKNEMMAPWKNECADRFTKTTRSFRHFIKFIIMYYLFSKLYQCHSVLGRRTSETVENPLVQQSSKSRNVTTNVPSADTACAQTYR